jgi:hypothetical protein
MAAPAKLVNPNAEIVSRSQCLAVNVGAARGLQMVLKTNLGACVHHTYLILGALPRECYGLYSILCKCLAICSCRV